MWFTEDFPRDRAFIEEMFHPNNRPNVLARDLVSYMFRLRGNRNWSPIPFKTYTIHPLSPLTPSIRQAIGILMENWKNDAYKIRHQEVVASARGEHLVGFVHHGRFVLHCFLTNPQSGINDLFNMLCYLARLGVEFDERGSHDAPHFACILICDALWRTHPDIYRQLNLHARNVIDAKEAFYA